MTEQEQKVIDAYFPPGTDQREHYDRWVIEYPGRLPLNWILFQIHTHAEIAYDIDPEQIVYREKDILKLLKILGFETDWDDRKPKRIK